MVRKELFKVVLAAVVVLVVLLTIGASFKNKTWTGSNFPYIGAYFCHNDDYVRFNCTEEMHRFYYMTAKDRDAYVEFYVDGKRQGPCTFCQPASGIKNISPMRTGHISTFRKVVTLDT